MVFFVHTVPDAVPAGPPVSPVTGARPFRLRPRHLAYTVADPAEPWEIPVPKKDRYKIDQMRPGRPFRPAQAADIPAPALPALESVCGTLPFERLFIVPRTSRLVSRSGQRVNRLDCVITPTQVLAFGEESVAVWIDDGPDGRLISTPIDSLLAVDQRTILLYGRLRLVALDRQLVARFNTVARWDLQENLSRLRAAMATACEPVEPGFLWLDPRNQTMEQSALPHKWRVVLAKPAVRPDPSEPVAIAVGDVTEIGPGRTRPASGVAVLGSRELVIANEPVEYLDRSRYGADLLAVPRRRLDSLSWDGRSLAVRVAQEHAGAQAATTVTLPLDPCLVEAMWRVFGTGVRWI